MPRKSRERKARKLASGLDKHLSAHVAIAAAAGVGLLVTAEPASAEVVFTSSDAVVTCEHHHNLSIDLNGDGIVDFNLLGGVYLTFHEWGIAVSGPTGNSAIAVGINQSSEAAALEPHSPIVPTRFFQPVDGSIGLLMAETGNTLGGSYNPGGAIRQYSQPSCRCAFQDQRRKSLWLDRFP